MSTGRPLEPQPFLEQDPPPWAARALATVLLLLFGVMIVALVVVRVPETVLATFSLEPVRGSDPIRALHPGIVSVIHVADAQIVTAHQVMFVLASELVGDRVSERQTVDARLSGGRGRLGNERVKYENQQRADEQERVRLEERLANLDRQSELKRQQLALLQDMASRQRRGFDDGILSWLDANRPSLEVDRLAGELEGVRTEIVDSRNTMARLAFEIASRKAAFAELERTIDEELTTYRARKDMLDRDQSRDGNAMSVEAPCAGTVVKLHVQHSGSVVHEGDLLAEMVCAGERLQAEVTLPERGLALVRIGQPVKLLYDAFPYQRYGVQYGVLKWLSPASTVKAQGTAFRALADLDSDTVVVQGRPQPVLPGMTGRAAVVVGRRSLASYALEPLRQMRESLSTGPPEKAENGPAR